MVAILGPTATGKSRLAYEVAERTGASILSVDSMQVYRDMDIGTAKPSPLEQARFPHHMVDIVDPSEEFTVAEFQAAARHALRHETAPVVLVVGGSGLHFRSVVDPMTFRPTDRDLRTELEQADPADLVAELLVADPTASEVVDLANPRRVLRSVEAIRLGGDTPSERESRTDRLRYKNYEPDLDFAGFALDRSDPAPAIAARLAQMRTDGLVDEVRRLVGRWGRTASQAVGYRQLADVVEGSMNEEDAFEAAGRATMALVKRQRTFFRRDPRLRWLDADEDGLVDTVVREAQL